MQKDDIRERLVELLLKSSKHHEELKEKWILAGKPGKRPSILDSMADHLITYGVTVQRWIPVSEQLPTEEDEDVSGCVLAIERQDGFTRRWAGRSVRNCPELFTYWMPLPQAPKEDDDAKGKD